MGGSQHHRNSFGIFAHSSQSARPGKMGLFWQLFNSTRRLLAMSVSSDNDSWGHLNSKSVGNRSVNNRSRGRSHNNHASKRLGNNSIAAINMVVGALSGVVSGGMRRNSSSNNMLRMVDDNAKGAAI